MLKHLYPEFAEAYWGRGSVFAELGQFEKALKDLNQCIKLDPGISDAFYNRAFVYMATDESQKALNDLNMYILLNPGDINGYFSRLDLLVKLEQNYRSTSNILNAANAVISKNAERLGKSLWTDSGEGEPIALYAAFNEHDEARYIADRLQSWVNQGNLREDSAILYRSNAQSRVLEAALLQADIPYRIYGGQRF